MAAIPLYPPSSRVGAWIASHGCLARMARRGHRVDVVRLLTTEPSYEFDGVHVHGRKRIGLIESADVVVSHLGDDGRAHTAAVGLGKPSVRMVHGFTPDAEKKLQGATLAVFNSEATQAEFDAPGIVCRPITEALPTTPGDRVTLVNLCEPKGGVVFHLLAVMMPGTPFLGVKGGYGKQYVRSLPNVENIEVTQDMRGDVYARTRVLLMPSERESWGMTGLEAMCSGIPVVAHPTAGLRESLGDAGIFVDRAGLTGWKAELERLADEEEWMTASKRSLARVDHLDTSGPDRFCDALEQL